MHTTVFQKTCTQRGRKGGRDREIPKALLFLLTYNTILYLQKNKLQLVSKAFFKVYSVKQQEKWAGLLIHISQPKERHG